MPCCRCGPCKLIAPLLGQLEKVMLHCMFYICWTVVISAMPILHGHTQSCSVLRGRHICEIIVHIQKCMLWLTAEEYVQEFEGGLKIVKVEADPCPNLVEKYKVISSFCTKCVVNSSMADDVSCCLMSAVAFVV